MDIDEIDRKLIALLNERAHAAKEIGRLKRDTDMPIYEPERERIIYENAQRENKGPLPNLELRHIYERIIDVMRKLQKEEIHPEQKEASHDTEFDAEVNE
jgi:chorismate mutase